MLKSSASTGKGVYGWSSVRVERTPVAGSQVGAGMYGEVAQKSVKLPSVCPGCLLFSIKHENFILAIPAASAWLDNMAASILIYADNHVPSPPYYIASPKIGSLDTWVPFKVISERTGINPQMARSPARFIPLLQLSPHRPNLSIESLPISTPIATKG